MKKNKQGAFTLLELLVVIAMIGILISLGVASFSNAQRKARDSRRREDIKSVQNGLEQYYADHDGSYPVGTAMGGAGGVITLAGTDYFPAGAPEDPKLGQVYYITSNTGAFVGGYCACAQLETPLTGNSSDANCTFTSGGSHFCVINLQ